ncbi:hypothetical protein FISHEDRAFT_54928 [Fistulina hepatica ATCC 64428]|uniref:Uncharacterized protein n=1 Tax=Fistulina hepatica ATCC 64428 TaxID=1128425 RepID=A0A0D7AQK1_9AGAR|nr:hypothetical protein FISHEDRAFT_54928 [Fistulina hepatica ATCC 64428]
MGKDNHSIDELKKRQRRREAHRQVLRKYQEKHLEETRAKARARYHRNKANEEALDEHEQADRHARCSENSQRSYVNHWIKRRLTERAQRARNYTDKHGEAQAATRPEFEKYMSDPPDSEEEVVHTVEEMDVVYDALRKEGQHIGRWRNSGLAADDSSLEDARDSATTDASLTDAPSVVGLEKNLDVTPAQSLTSVVAGPSTTQWSGHFCPMPEFWPANPNDVMRLMHLVKLGRKMGMFANLHDATCSVEGYLGGMRLAFRSVEQCREEWHRDCRTANHGHPSALPGIPVPAVITGKFVQPPCPSWVPQGEPMNVVPLSDHPAHLSAVASSGEHESHSTDSRKPTNFALDLLFPSPAGDDEQTPTERAGDVVTHDNSMVSMCLPVGRETSAAGDESTSENKGELWFAVRISSLTTLSCIYSNRLVHIGKIINSDAYLYLRATALQKAREMAAQGWPIEFAAFPTIADATDFAFD